MVRRIGLARVGGARTEAIVPTVRSCCDNRSGRCQRVHLHSPVGPILSACKSRGGSRRQCEVIILTSKATRPVVVANCSISDLPSTASLGPPPERIVGWRERDRTTVLRLR